MVGFLLLWCVPGLIISTAMVIDDYRNGGIDITLFQLFAIVLCAIFGWLAVGALVVINQDRILEILESKVVLKSTKNK